MDEGRHGQEAFPAPEDASAREPRSASSNANLLSAARHRVRHLAPSGRHRRRLRLREPGGGGERTDMALMTRGRLADRIERLTAALERVSQGQ
jgi:hypothetical protein